jgi:tetratricopeptide (TPR) repeat protein
VRKSGDKVRITVQLIRASDSTHLWSETYDRTLDDIFKVQDEIAAAVVGRLKISLLGALPTAKPVDPKVYPLILQARALANNRTADSTTQALALMQQALELAPGEARTWDVLTELYITRTTIGSISNAEGFRLARESANKALAIDPDDALAHSYLGRMAGYDNDFAAAAQHYQRALALNPTDSNVLINVGRFATWLRHFDDARGLLQYVTSHDPANPAGHYNIGLTCYQSGQWDPVDRGVPDDAGTEPVLCGWALRPRGRAPDEG